MSYQSDFYSSVYNAAKDLGATETQAHLAASQASLETGYGQNVVGNSFFGIKASPSYTGDAVDTPTHEEVNGSLVGQNGRFRAYDSLKASVADYMDMMSRNFPESWNAENFSDAVHSLVNGKFGAYASLSAYPDRVEKIGNKYGKYAYAQNPENVPIPYGPLDDPVAMSPQAQATDGLSGILNPAIPTPVLREDLPVLGPSVNNFADLAGAGPMAAPVNVQANANLGMPTGLPASTDVAMGAPVGPVSQGILSPVGTPVNSGWTDMASARPMGILSNIPASAQAVANPGFDASAVAGLGAQNNISTTGLPNGEGDLASGRPPTQSSSFADRFGLPSTTWADVADAGPIQAPQNVSTVGLPTGASDLASSLGRPNVASVNDRMGIPSSSWADMAAARPVQTRSYTPALNSFADLAAAKPVVPQFASLPTVNTPALNNFADLANAGPVQAPQTSGINSAEQQAMDASVTAALAGMHPLGATASKNSFSALANAGPMSAPINVPASAQISTTPALSATASVPMSSVPADTGALASRFAPTIDPTTNTTSFIDGPVKSPSLNSFAPVAAATPVGILGQQITSTPTVSQPVTTGLLSGYEDTAVSNTPAANAINTVAPIGVSPNTASSYQQAAQSMMDAGLLGLDGSKYTDLSGNITTNPAMADLANTPNFATTPSTTIGAQPTTTTDQTQDNNVTVAGPATTTAAVQNVPTQQTQITPTLSGAFPSAPTKTGLLGGLVNKGTITGGILGTIAGGPVGGILGGLLGNQVNKAGGLQGIFGGQPMSIKDVGTGLQNVTSVYGSSSPGLQATANNGDKVTSLGNGWTAVTNQYGVTTSFGPNGLTASYFGPSLTGDSHTPSGPGGGGGGFSSGLF